MTDRLKRLFACACCRHVWHKLPKVCQDAIRVAEQYADGLISRANLSAARSAADETVTDDSIYEDLTVFASLDDGTDLEYYLRNFFESIITAPIILADMKVRRIPNYTLTNKKLIHSLATSVYEHRASDFGNLDDCNIMILCDALEEFGTDCEVLINHFKGSRYHYRGCWAVDELIKSSRENNI